MTDEQEGHDLRIFKERYLAACEAAGHKTGNAFTLIVTVRKLIARAEKAENALDGLLERYVGLVNCGDCGFWDPEKEPCVIAAREVLARDAK